MLTVDNTGIPGKDWVKKMVIEEQVREEITEEVNASSSQNKRASAETSVSQLRASGNGSGLHVFRSGAGFKRRPRSY